VADKYAYCVWCNDKNEGKLLDKLRDGYGYEAFSPMRKRVLRNSQRTLIDEVPLTPGYVFFYTDTPIAKDKLNWLKQYYHILEYTDGTSELQGDDHRYAMWLYRHGGMVGLSQGIMDPETKYITFVSGPILEFGEIKKFNRSKQYAVMECNFMGEPRLHSLSFEIVAA